MKKRFPAIILALALCMGLAVPAFAANTKTTYHLNFSQITTAENSEVSITGEGLERTGEIFCEYGLGAGQDEAPRDYYPVFTASRPVTVTVTANYTDWRHTGTDRESGDNFDYISYAAVAGLSYNPATGEYTEITEHAAYFDGTYATRLYDGSIKENAGTLRDYYTGADAQEDMGQTYIYAGASVTLSQPGIYKIIVQSNNLWSSRMNYAVIHITADVSQPVNPPRPVVPSFTDIPAWCSAAVGWAVEQKITNGYEDNTFRPGIPCTHAQILTFLWRAAGEPTPTGEAPVAVEPYYQDGIDWAYGKGIVDDTSFVPNAPCTRADAVNYIWQCFDTPTAIASSFSDVPTGAPCSEAVSWAVASGLTNGFEDGTFHPYEVCSRGQIVTFLHRAYVPSARLTVNS